MAAADQWETGDRGPVPFVLASRGRRLVAALLDGLLVIVAILGPIVGVLLVSPTAFDSSTLTIDKATGDVTELKLGDGAVAAVLLVVLALLVLLVVNLVLVARNGQSVGKRICNIRIVRPDGSDAGFWRIIGLRWIVSALPSLVPTVGRYYSLIDVLFIFQASRRCLHDRIAGTIVVDAVRSAGGRSGPPTADADPSASW